MSFLTSRLFREPPGNLPLILGTSIATTIGIITLTRLALSSPSKKRISSPRDTALSQISIAEREDLPYPPDAFPGSRDVTSPYGTIKVFEWGPIDGRKVLLVHGISTPCVALGGIALGLVARGCRVILFDLFGRGYSDGIGDLPYDSRLYTTQILLAITSSPIAWTPDGFSIIGYSLGGGISIDFAASFPEMVKGMVLLAPAGLIRTERQGWATRFIFGSGLVPDVLLEWNVRRRLGVGKALGKQETGSANNPVTNDELRGNRDPQFEAAVLCFGRQKTVKDVLQWQIDHHDGFVGAFIGSMKHASIFGCDEGWKIIGKRKEKVLVVAGTTDAVILLHELRADADKAAGPGNIAWKEIDGGHEFAVTESAKVVELVSEYWNLKG